ncbi:hypothetical protein [Parafrankia sp. EUN1f]|uniref:hypothetical protein n=1 Tax=Parafrankia sp. EUN1f TaxID=102897 RepID=UPI0001C45111|nr:hypothetical protein [Parafrankia sp. EUN1f]EFC85205.1 hypothetical protein FrEUN1fDRAFT_1658 [Parafrankia sp. EUN1f]
MIVASLLLATITIGASPGARASDDGTIGVRLMEVTDSLRLDPRARQYLIDHLEPGATIDRRVEVTNNGDEPRRIVVYPGAATVGKGHFSFGESHAVNELTTWASVDRSVLEVAAHSTDTVTVRVTVPTDASPGEHYGVIWAETASSANGGTGVQLVNRVGIRVYLDIGPGGPAPSAFTMSDIVARRMDDGRPAMITTVHNTGGRALDITGELRLADGPGGLQAGPFDARLGTTVAPGESDPVTVFLDPLVPAGPWKATITLRSGLVENTLAARIRFPDRPDTQTGPVRERLLPFLPLDGPAAIALVTGTGALVAALALLAGRAAHLRHTRHGRHARRAGDGPAQE